MFNKMYMVPKNTTVNQIVGTREYFEKIIEFDECLQRGIIVEARLTDTFADLVKYGEYMPKEKNGKEN